MGFPEIYDFLERLQANNKKEWMDVHRKEYQQLRKWFVNWLDAMNERLATIDPNYTDTPGKKGINRINNNLMFHPDRPVYKDHFSGGLDQLSKQGDFYVHFGVSESLIFSGYYRPGSEILGKIREAIDYNGDELKEIISAPAFQSLFGGLWAPDDKLTNAPKGYDGDHPHIDLLKLRNFGIEYSLTRKQVSDPGFEELVAEVYLAALPFRRYLLQAVAYEG